MAFSMEFNVDDGNPAGGRSIFLLSANVLSYLSVGQCNQYLADRNVNLRNKPVQVCQLRLVE